MIVRTEVAGGTTDTAQYGGEKQQGKEPAEQKAAPPRALCRCGATWSASDQHEGESGNEQRTADYPARNDVTRNDEQQPAPTRYDSEEQTADGDGNPRGQSGHPFRRTLLSRHQCRLVTTLGHGVPVAGST